MNLYISASVAPALRSAYAMPSVQHACAERISILYLSTSGAATSAFAFRSALHCNALTSGAMLYARNVLLRGETVSRTIGFLRQISHSVSESNGHSLSSTHVA